MMARHLMKLGNPKGEHGLQKINVFFNFPFFEESGAEFKQCGFPKFISQFMEADRNSFEKTLKRDSRQHHKNHQTKSEIILCTKVSKLSIVTKFCSRVRLSVQWWSYAGGCGLIPGHVWIFDRHQQHSNRVITIFNLVFNHHLLNKDMLWRIYIFSLYLPTHIACCLWSGKKCHPRYWQTIL